MADYEILGPYLIALLMSLSAVFVFMWAVLSGAFNGADEAALKFYRAEVGDDGNAEQAGR